VESRRRQQEAHVGHGRLGQYEGHVAGGEGGLERGHVLPVVLAVEQQHDLAACELAGQADDLGVGLGRRRGELPLRQPVAAREVLGDDDRVLAGQQELVAECHPARDRLDDRRRRVAAKALMSATYMSRYVWPSTSVKRAPSPCATQTGGWS
jgi:hypothetical protein